MPLHRYVTTTLKFAETVAVLYNMEEHTRPHYLHRYVTTAQNFSAAVAILYNMEEHIQCHFIGM